MGIKVVGQGLTRKCTGRVFVETKWTVGYARIVFESNWTSRSLRWSRGAADIRRECPTHSLRQATATPARGISRAGCLRPDGQCPIP